MKTDYKYEKRKKDLAKKKKKEEKMLRRLEKNEIKSGEDTKQTSEDQNQPVDS